MTFCKPACAVWTEVLKSFLPNKFCPSVTNVPSPSRGLSAGKTVVAWALAEKLGLGRLPGDIVIERNNFRLYIPITTSILISVVLSAVFWLLNR